MRDDEIKFDVLLTFIFLGIPNGSWPLFSGANTRILFTAILVYVLGA